MDDSRGTGTHPTPSFMGLYPCVPSSDWHGPLPLLSSQSSNDFLVSASLRLALCRFLCPSHPWSFLPSLSLITETYPLPVLQIWAVL